MKVLLAGWNENALYSLRALIRTKHIVSAVILPKDYDTSVISLFCDKKNINCLSGDSADILKYAKKYKVDIIISASWPKILKEEVFSYPKYGSINIHAGMLPKYRGQHPLNWAIIRGEKSIGVTVHYISSGVDNGDIILQKSFKVLISDDINSVRKKATTLGSKLLIDSLTLLESNSVKRIKQNDSQATFAPKRCPEDGHINWNSSIKDIRNLVRSLVDPYPNAFTFSKDGKKILVKKTYVSNECGKVLFKFKDYYGVGVIDGVILIHTEKKLKVGDMLF